MAGAGYDISASRSEALAQAANAAAPTIFNFGSGAVGLDMGGQTANPTTTSTAARQAVGSGNAQGALGTSDSPGAVSAGVFGSRDILVLVSIAIGLIALLKR